MTHFFVIFTQFFARHKFSAARHLKLFCTPAVGVALPPWHSSVNGAHNLSYTAGCIIKSPLDEEASLKIYEELRDVNWDQAMSV